MKIPPPLTSTCQVTSYTSYENPTPSGKYIQSHILHVISKSHPVWQVNAKSHLTRDTKIPPPLGGTCTVTSYTSYQNPNPLWQVHAKSHLTRHMKIPPPLASTCTVTSYTSYENSNPSGNTCTVTSYTSSRILCTVTSYTSYQNPTASGKYIQSHI